MAHDYTLHTVMVATCPICGCVDSSRCLDNGQSRSIDLPAHIRATDRGSLMALHAGTGEKCPGSGMTVKLKSTPAGEYRAKTTPAPSDDEPFPFGKHKGVRYGDMTAGYLDWITSLPWLNKWPKVVAYIEKNRANIDKDLETEGKI